MDFGHLPQLWHGSLRGAIRELKLQTASLKVASHTTGPLGAVSDTRNVNFRRQLPQKMVKFDRFGLASE